MIDRSRNRPTRALCRSARHRWPRPDEPCDPRGTHRQPWAWLPADIAVATVCGQPGVVVLRRLDDNRPWASAECLHREEEVEDAVLVLRRA